MKHFGIIIVALILLSGCCTAHRVVTTVPMAAHDSVSVITRYIERTRIDTVTIEVAVPVESVTVVTLDTASHVETSIAESDAWINSDGSLGHTIRNKNQPFSAVVHVPATDTESIASDVTIRDTPVPYPEPVEVEREFTAMERVKLGAFWWLVAVVIAAAAWKCRRLLLSLLRKITL